MKQGRSFSGLEKNCSFLNTGASEIAKGRFATISASSGIDFPDDGRALVPVDWDHDGDLDLWISARNAPRVRFLRNDNPSSNDFLAIRLVGNGKETNRDAIGARIEIVTTAQTGRNIQSLRAGEGFLSQESKWFHFGLSSNDLINHVIVHWPGGESEKFSEIETNNRYSLVQGSGTATLWPARDPVKLQDSDPIVPGPSQKARIPLLTRLPKTTINYQNLEGSPKHVTTGIGNATLVMLWAGWCPTCKLELSEFTERQQDFRSAGIDVLALSVDGLGDDRSDLDRAKKLLEDLDFPFSTGIATPQLIHELQELHDLVIPLKHPLPVPTSFLIDSTGRISVIYKGQAMVDEIIRDSKERKRTPANAMRYAAPLKGTSINEPLIDKVFLKNQARALFYYGTYLFDNQQTDDAILFFLDVLEIRPNSYKTHYNLGLAFKSRNNLESALYHFDQSIRINPDLDEAHLMLGGLLLHRGQFELAKQHYLKHLSGYPDNPISLTALGVIAAQLGNVDEAIQRFSRVVKIAPDFVEAQYNLAALFLAQGKNSKSETLFLSLLKTHPNYPDIHFNLGTISENKKNFAKAEYFYLKELRIRPTSAKTLTAIGLLMERKGNLLQASNYYNRAISAQPNFPPAQSGLTRLREK